jgi:oxygen-dependent protoporphyrinogen oxidase
MKKVVVVGAGFSGLVTAYYLGRQGYAVDIYEASNHVGGLLSSELTPYGLVESAANSMMSSPEVEALFSDLGLKIMRPRTEFKRKRFIFRHGLRRWPLSWVESLGLFFRVVPKMLFAKQSLKPLPQESVWQWGRRHFGPAATKFLITPALQGIYAGDVQKLSADLIFGGMFTKDQRTRYKGSIAPEQGMGELIQALKDKIQDQGAKLHLNSTYVIASLEIPHVVCVSAAASSQVVRTISPELSRQLAKIEILPLISATLFLENPVKKIRGFGCLIPEGFRIQSLGVLSNTFIFDRRGPGYSETWILGGAKSPALLLKSDQELIHLLQNDRGKLLGEEGKVTGFRIHRWPKALPHFTVEHNNLIRALVLPKNLYLNGNYLDVIGLSKILVRSQQLVQNLGEELQKENHE